MDTLVGHTAVELNQEAGAPYQFDGCQDVDDGAVQLLAVGHDVGQRVEVSAVLHWQVEQRQQPLHAGAVATHTHLGVGLRQQQPVEAAAAQTLLTSRFMICHRSLIKVIFTIT